MPITFPTTLDTLSNPTATDTLASVPHDTQHANANDAIEALEAKVGVNSSAVTTSHDYKLGEVTGSDKAVGKTATQTLTNKTLTAPVINVGSDADGDTYYRSGGVFTRLPKGTVGHILTQGATVPSWQANAAGADANTTTKGVSEEADATETQAGTATGATAARLFVNPSQLGARNHYYYATDTGSSVAYAISVTPVPTAYAAGQVFIWMVTNTNASTAPTLNVNSLGAKTIVNPDLTSLAIGQLPAGSIIQTVYDGIYMQLLSVKPFSAFTVSTEIGSSYQTHEIPLIATTGTSAIGWTAAACTFTTISAGGYHLLTPTASANLELSVGLPGVGTSAGYSVAANKAIRVKGRARFPDLLDRKGFGFVVTAANIHTAQTDVTNGEVRFVLNGSTMYAQNANGSSATSVDVSSGFTFTNWNTFEIVFVPGVSAKFYINGTLVATNTTNLPTSGTLLLAYGVNANGRTIEINPPTISIEL